VMYYLAVSVRQLMLPVGVGLMMWFP
jgi:hypothetical protein